jgi:hypothetical protein
MASWTQCAQCRRGRVRCAAPECPATAFVTGLRHSCIPASVGAFPYWLYVIRTTEERVRDHSLDEELVELLVALVLAIVLISVVGERIA